MKLLLLLLKSSIALCSVAVVMSGFSALATIALIALIHQVLEQAGSPSVAQIWWFVGLCVALLGGMIASQIALTKVSQRSVSELLLNLSERILGVPLRNLESMGSNRALAALTIDVSTISIAVQGIPVLCGNLLALLFGLLYLGYLSTWVLVGSVVFIAIGYGSYQWLATFAERYIRSARQSHDKLIGQLKSLVEGVKELKLHDARRRAFIDGDLARTNQKVRDDQFMGFSIQASAVSWGRLMFFIAIGVLLFGWGGQSVADRANLTGCVLTVLFLMSPLERIIAWLPILSRAKVSLEKIETLGASVVPEAMRADQRSGENRLLNSSFGKLELRNIEFQYLDTEIAAGAKQMARPDRSFCFGPIDFELQRGEVVFLVGGNGSGKTTFIKLLTGLYIPSAGSITLDGIAIDEANGKAGCDAMRQNYRQLFAVVFAEPVLFGSLLGLEAGCDASRVDALLRHLELDKVVSVTDGILSSTDLSKGQRKRLALLTAYLEDRPIYVFDEWAADQDPLYKRVFYEEILPNLQRQGKAIVVISHDDQYYDHADRIVKLENGLMLGNQDETLALAAMATKEIA